MLNPKNKPILQEEEVVTIYEEEGRSQGAAPGVSISRPNPQRKQATLEVPTWTEEEEDLDFVETYVSMAQAYGGRALRGNRGRGEWWLGGGGGVIYLFIYPHTRPSFRY